VICFCIGICSGKFFGIPFLWLYALVWILVIFAFIFVKHKNCVWLMFSLALILGGLCLSGSNILRLNHIRNFTFYKSEDVTLCGTVSNFPTIKSNSCNLILEAEQLTWAGKVYSVCGKVNLKMFRKENIDYADQLVVKGKLFRPYEKGNSPFSFRSFLENQGIYSMFIVNKRASMQNLGKGRANPLMYFAYKTRQRCKHILFSNLKFTQAAIFSGMILGDRTGIPSHIRRLFVQTGTVHMLAISGLHVGIIAFIFDTFLKVVRIKRRRRYLIIIFLLIFYCCLSGGRPSVVRAVIMAIVLLCGFLLKREVLISHSLSLAALIILTINPRQLFNSGFQLSFISVISIVSASCVINKLYNPNNKLLKFFICAFSASFAAWLGVLPFVACYFRVISPIGVLANLVIVPYLALIVSLGCSLLVGGFVFPFLASAFAATANLAVFILLKIITFFSSLPCAYYYL